jgi:hypothetical protein
MVVEDWEGGREREVGRGRGEHFFRATAGRRRRTPVGGNDSRSGGPGGGAVGAPWRSAPSRLRGALGEEGVQSIFEVSCSESSPRSQNSETSSGRCCGALHRTANVGFTFTRFHEACTGSTVP